VVEFNTRPTEAGGLQFQAMSTVDGSEFKQLFVMEGSPIHHPMLMVHVTICVFRAASLRCLEHLKMIINYDVVGASQQTSAEAGGGNDSSEQRD
jgi:hypothetical protein